MPRAELGSADILHYSIVQVFNSYNLNNKSDFDRIHRTLTNPNATTSLASDQAGANKYNIEDPVTTTTTTIITQNDPDPELTCMQKKMCRIQRA